MNIRYYITRYYEKPKNHKYATFKKKKEKEKEKKKENLARKIH